MNKTTKRINVIELWLALTILMLTIVGIAQVLQLVLIFVLVVIMTINILFIDNPPTKKPR